VLIAITGASGVQIAIKLLESLNKKRIMTELIISKIAKEIIHIETDINISDIRK